MNPYTPYHRSTCSCQLLYNIKSLTATGICLEIRMSAYALSETQKFSHSMGFLFQTHWENSRVTLHGLPWLTQTEYELQENIEVPEISDHIEWNVPDYTMEPEPRWNELNALFIARCSHMYFYADKLLSPKCSRSCSLPQDICESAGSALRRSSTWIFHNKEDLVNTCNVHFRRLWVGDRV